MIRAHLITHGLDIVIELLPEISSHHFFFFCSESEREREIIAIQGRSIEVCLSHLLGCCLYSSKGSLSLNHLSITHSMHLVYSVRVRIMMVSVRKEWHCHRHHQISKLAVSSIFGNQNCILPFVVSTLFLSVTKTTLSLMENVTLAIPLSNITRAHTLFFQKCM